jgi:hypothetical protein
MEDHAQLNFASMASRKRGDGLRRFGGGASPDRGEIALGRIGQSEDERVANSFLPRSTVRLRRVSEATGRSVQRG